jgi:hypothetical protein
LKTRLLVRVAQAMMAAGMEAYAMVLMAEAGRFDFIVEQLKKSDNSIAQAEYLQG